MLFDCLLPPLILLAHPPSPPITAFLTIPPYFYHFSTFLLLVALRFLVKKNLHTFHFADFPYESFSQDRIPSADGLRTIHVVGDRQPFSAAAHFHFDRPEQSWLRFSFLFSSLVLVF